jgi:long-chain acyl-CoA synthetase
VVLGALRTGIIPVIGDPQLPARERAELLDDAAPDLVVATHADLAGLLTGSPVDLADVPLGRPMYYTSGTTGRRKGVYSGLLDQAEATALLDEEAALWSFGPDDLHLVLSPLHHSAPLRFASHTLMAGGRVLLAGKFDASTAYRLIERHRPTTTFCVPTQLRRLRAMAGEEWPELSSFRLVAHAGEHCPELVKRWAVQALPAGSVYEFYGSTEGQFTVCSTDEWRERPTTVGRARPGRSLSTDDDGTIWCRAPRHARFSYWRAPDRTARAWRGDSFTVGDVGRLDDAGYLYLDGRREDLVITGGVNVYPREVERVLADCPGVVEVAVFGVPDDEWGQRLCAAVSGPVTARVLAEYARAHLASPKRPKTYIPVAVLPRTATGKVRRTDLAGLM